MQRRNFIKTAMCFGCMGLSGCSFSFKNKNDIKENKFIYKSKSELPKKIILEACSLCQLHCPQCPTGNSLKEINSIKTKQGYLKFEDFKKFVDDNDFEKIELSNHGEIFLNPELDEIIKYAHKKKIWLGAGSGVNLNTVSDRTLENLVKYQFLSMHISIDGATPETYKIYRVGGDFNTVIDNVKRINYYKEKYNSRFPELTWQFIPFGHNEHEIELAKKKASELNMNITFKKNFAPEYSPLKNKNLVKEQTKKKNTTKPQTACYLLFKSPCIDFDGTLLGCCNLSSPNDFKVNVFEVGLLNALNSKSFIEAKNMLTNLSMEPNENNPCFNCPSYKKIKNDKISILNDDNSFLKDK